MQLLRGNAALDAARRILDAADPVAAVEIDPPARAGGRIAVLAVANAREAALLDAAATPGLAPLLDGLEQPLGAHEAKEVHRALLRTVGAGPSRWACIRLTELLLAGGRDVDVALEATAERLNVPAPPAAEAGLAQLGERARLLAQIVAQQVPRLKAAESTAVSRIEAAAVAPIAEMEHHGMPFDGARWRAIDAEARREREALRGELDRLFRGVSGATLFGGAALNLESDLDLKRALHALGHSVPNVRRETVAALPEPLGSTLARYRELTKLVTAYGESFLEHVGDDGRLHATFEQLGASTGRMACHSPNLQAVVKDSPHRACFRCGPRRALVTADYAACELRIIAEVSGDPVFAEAFARGEDLHARVASAIFGKPVSKTENPELRERAKAVNFGLAYGMGAQGLARAIDADVAQARQLLERYFKTFPRIRGYLERSAREALERGYARTLAGRRLYLTPGDDPSARAQAERIAKNMPIQGTSADMTKIALARLRARLRAEPASFVVNAVHDEIVVECAAERADTVAQTVREEMKAAGAQLLVHVPVEVDVHVATIWGK